MSYILDALKQSEQKREGIAVPDLQTVQETVAPKTKLLPNRQQTIVGILVIMVLAGGGIAGWWYAGQGGSADKGELLGTATLPSSTEPAFVSPAPVTTSSTTEPAGTSPVPSRSPSIVEGPASSRGLQDDDYLEEAAAQVLTQKEPSSVPSPAAPAHTQPDIEFIERGEQKVSVEREITKAPIDSIESGLAKTTNGPEQEERVEQEVVAEKALAVGESAEDRMALNASAGAQDREVVEETGEESSRPPHFRELPYDVQQKLPELKYSVHLYAPNPARRMVKINGNVRREGDEVFSGVILEEITPNGAIFTYRDYRFRKPVN